jgi:hypothetical protein
MGLLFVRVIVSSISQLSICIIIYIFLPNVCIGSIYKASVSLGSVQQIMPYFSSLCYSDSLVTWMVICLTTAKFKLLIFCVVFLLVQCYEHFHCHDLVWLPLVACGILLCNHMYRSLKAMCKSWTSVHLRKLPLVRRTLFCRRCNSLDGHLSQILRLN